MEVLATDLPTRIDTAGFELSHCILYVWKITEIKNKSELSGKPTVLRLLRMSARSIGITVTLFLIHTFSPKLRAMPTVNS